MGEQTHYLTTQNLEIGVFILSNFNSHKHIPKISIVFWKKALHNVSRI